MRVLELEKIGLNENFAHLQSGMFATISLREKFPICGIIYLFFLKLVVYRSKSGMLSVNPFLRKCHFNLKVSLNDRQIDDVIKRRN